MTSRLEMVQRFRFEFGVVTLLLGMAATGLAADHSAVVSGVVRDARGVPQMGALVQILAPDDGVRATAFTDMQGRYLVARLLPGIYGVRASAALFLPVSREHLRLQPDRRAIVNLTLSGLFDEPAWLPARAKGASEPADDWNWTLRSSANRPILKLADDDSSASATPPERRGGADIHLVRATLASASKNFGSGGARFSLRAERVRANRSRLTLSTSLGAAKTPRSSEAPLSVASAIERKSGSGGVLGSRIAYESHPEISGVRGVSGGTGIEVFAISSAERFGVGEFAEIEAGSRVQAVRGATSAVVARPFLRLSAHPGLHPGSSWRVTYSLATSRDTQDYDSAVLRDADLPTAVHTGARTEVEGGVHQEIALSHGSSATLLALAFYADAMDQVSLSGTGDPFAKNHSLGDPASGPSEILFDQSNGSFKALSHGYHNAGFNVLITRALGSGTWVTLQYCSGTAMALTEVHQSALGSGLPALQARRSQAATASVKASIARTGTKVRTSYRWQPDLLLTSIDPYDVLAGGEFLSLHLRQPLSRLGVLPDGVELTVDGTNMLGQGRQRFVGRNGSPLYLASTPTSLQAGIAFSF